MLQELIVTGLVGGVIALDKTEACQTMLSQPLLVGPLVGLLLDDLPSGILMGMTLQLAYLWVMPIGTAAFPDSAVGTVVGSSGFIMLNRFFPERANLILLLILIFSIPFSLFAGWSLVKQRQLNSKLLPKADLCAERVEVGGFRRLLLLAISGSFLRGLVVTAAGIVCILILLKPLVRVLALLPEAYLDNAEIPVWGWGIGTMIYLFGRRRNLAWCIGGLCAGIVLILL